MLDYIDPKVYAHKIIYDFVDGIQGAMQEKNISVESVAAHMGITAKSVKRLLESMTLSPRTMVRLAQAVGMGVSFVPYESPDGFPLFAELFTDAWKAVGMPVDGFDRYHNLPGTYIALEGPDLAGKTAQMDRLEQWLIEDDIPYLRVAEPSYDGIGALIRTLIRTGETNERSISMLYAADRLDLWERKIEPALREGKVVISDRCFLSSMVYQGSALGNEWTRFVNSHMTYPDLIVILDISPQAALARLAVRGDGEEAVYERKEAIENACALYAGGKYGECFHVDVTGVEWVNAEQTTFAVFEDIKKRIGSNQRIKF